MNTQPLPNNSNPTKMSVASAYLPYPSPLVSLIIHPSGTGLTINLCVFNANKQEFL